MLRALLSVTRSEDLSRLLASFFGVFGASQFCLVSKVIHDNTNCWRRQESQLFPSRLCIFGGVNHNDEIERSGHCLLLSAEGQAWEELPQMFAKRSGAAVALLKGAAYFCGGVDEELQILSSVERFNPVTFTFEELPWMSARRTVAVAGALANNLMVAGGHDGEGTLSSVEAFDEESGTWQALQAMAEARAGAGVLTRGGRLYILGGRSDHGPEAFSPEGDYLSSMCCLEPADEHRLGASWKPAPSMHVARWRAAVSGGSSHLYVCGGCNSSNPALCCSEVFDLSTESWSMMAAMSVSRFGAVAAVLGDELYVFGGNDGERRLNSVERMDPSSMRWEMARPMARRCGGASAVVMRF